MKHRLFAFCMALLLCLGMFPTVFASASSDAAIDFSSTGSLSLYKYDMTTANASGVWDSATERAYRSAFGRGSGRM